MTPLARELLELALPTVKDYALVLFDAGGTIVGWLCGAEEIFGYAAEEVVGRHSSVLFETDDIAKGLVAYELHVAASRSYSHDDRWHLRKDGTRIWVSGTVTALTDASGLRGFIKLMRDRTDQKMDTQVRSNRANAAEDALERTRLFLETLGHELRNPLGPIKNASFILPRVSDDPRVHKIATMIGNQTASLERLAEDLMEVSRLEHRKLELRLAETDIAALVQDEVSGQQLPARAKGLQLLNLSPGQPLRALADPDRLRQAVTNLLTNAIKYTPDGGKIWAKVTQEGDDIVIRVEDTGIGITPEALPRIFELFTQEGRASDLVPGGLGVGLAMVRQIAELHGGVAQARSAGRNKGSEFSLRIPRRMAAAPQA
ncbi:MAG TPA: PAS domain-containing sensor histidine kinase [Ramlibacter sp.]|nr:PAS domain-containing sensor histidine kinase [Ramlibacter sp.]